MDLTFPHGRELLTKDLSKINDVLECYPILRSQKQVKFDLKFWFLSFNFLLILYPDESFKSHKSSGS